MEVFKDIPRYEGIYQVSNFGRVKSLERTKKTCSGTLSKVKERLLSLSPEKGLYLTVCLCKEGKQSVKKVHQLVATVFLNHIPNGHILVINHIDFDRQNNHVSNLEIVTARTNGNKKHLNSTSQYTGVSRTSDKKKWQSRILIDGKQKWLGRFETEIEASESYQKKLKTI